MLKGHYLRQLWNEITCVATYVKLLIKKMPKFWKLITNQHFSIGWVLFMWSKRPSNITIQFWKYKKPHTRTRLQLHLKLRKTNFMNKNTVKNLGLANHQDFNSCRNVVAHKCNIFVSTSDKLLNLSYWHLKEVSAGRR